MRFVRHVVLMAEDEEVVNDGMSGEMKRKDAMIENLNKTVTGLNEVINENEKTYGEQISHSSDRYSEMLREKDRELEGMRIEIDREREIHRLEQENLALRADVALQQQGQSQTPFLDGLARVGKGLIELDDRASRRPIEDPDQQ